MNKRDFIAGAGAGVLAAGCGAALAADAPRLPQGAPSPRRAARPVPLEGRQTRATWQQYLGHRFDVAGGALRLVAVADAPAATPAVDQFRLVFEASPGLVLDCDHLQHLRHATGQRLPLLLAPAGPGRWQAAFSLLT
jgi:hypothetical protein